MTRDHRRLTFSLSLIMVFVAVVAEMLFIRMNTPIDLVFATLVVVGMIGTLEMVLWNGLWSYLILFGAVPRMELVYFLTVPVIVGYFGHRMLGNNIVTIAGTVVSGLVLFYLLIDVRVLSFGVSTWAFNLALSVLWGVGVYLLWERMG